MVHKLRACLELMRPANIVTAFADILAGFAVAGGVIYFSDGELIAEPSGLLWLLLSTFGLYGGGVVYNDVFDAKLDAKERPERAIPSGRISRAAAAFLGGVLLLIGILSAFQVHQTAGIISIFIAVCALCYDWKAKHSVLWGPLLMGSCRGGNLLLGISIVPAVLVSYWPLAIIPVFYIASITLVSRGEVAGGSKLHGYLSLVIIAGVVVGLVLLSLLPEFELLRSIPFLVLFAVMVLPAFYYAAINPVSGTIKKAVKKGVISLVLMNSVIAAGFSGLLLGAIVFGVFLLSILTAKLFAVT
jgi:4-hydroxybenzoate polyprenyltransferase